MNWLLIVCKDSLRIWLEDAFPGGISEIVVAGKQYQAIASGQVFEWLFDSHGTVIGVELRLCSAKAILPSLLLCAPTQIDTTNLFPRIWFGPMREASTHGIQDWEEYYYRSDGGSWLIAVRPRLRNSAEH